MWQEDFNSRLSHRSIGMGGVTGSNGYLDVPTLGDDFTDGVWLNHKLAAVDNLSDRAYYVTTCCSSANIILSLHFPYS